METAVVSKTEKLDKKITSAWSDSQFQILLEMKRKFRKKESTESINSKTDKNESKN